MAFVQSPSHGPFVVEEVGIPLWNCCCEENNAGQREEDGCKLEAKFEAPARIEVRKLRTTFC